MWDQMKAEGRIALDRFPEDWKYYTLTFPVARYKHLSMDRIIDEMMTCDRTFYSMAEPPAPGLEQPMGTPSAADQSGGQPFIPKQFSAEL